MALEHAAAALRVDREVVLAAVAQDGRALKHADAALRADRKVLLAAVANGSDVLERMGRKVLVRLLKQSDSEVESLKAQVKRFRTEVVVIDVDNGSEEVVHVEGVAPPAKRQRTTERAGAAVASHLAGRMAVKKERAEEAKDDLDDAQETLGYVVLSENNKMSEIDELKAKNAELTAEIERLNRLLQR